MADLNQNLVEANEERETLIKSTQETQDGAPPDSNDESFNSEIIKNYPKSNRRLNLNVERFGIKNYDASDKSQNGQSVHISPQGIEFKTTEDFQEGSLLKIHVAIPDYWHRKQKFVDYTRIDAPDDFRVLAKVVKCEDVGKRGKKRVITVQTLVIDEVDEQVLKSFLQEN